MQKPAPPKGLKGEGLKYWNENLPKVLQRSMLSEANLVLFRRMCQQVATAEKAQGQLDKLAEHFEVKIDGNGNEVTKPHALISIIKTAEDQICRLGRQLELWGRQATRESSYTDPGTETGPTGIVGVTGTRKKVTRQQA